MQDSLPGPLTSAVTHVDWFKQRLKDRRLCLSTPYACCIQLPPAQGGTPDPGMTEACKEQVQVSAC